MAARAILLLEAAQGVSDAGDLDQPISLLRGALAGFPAGHPHRPGLLSALGVALQRRFMRAGNPADAREAVAFARLAVRDCPPSHPGWPEALSNLGIALDARTAA